MTLNDLERRNSPYFAFFSLGTGDCSHDGAKVTFRRGDGDLPVCCCLSKTGTVVSLSHLEAKTLSSARMSANCSVRTSSVADLVGLVSCATLAA